jgi:hypothetical protein
MAKGNRQNIQTTMDKTLHRKLKDSTKRTPPNHPVCEYIKKRTVREKNEASF